MRVEVPLASEQTRRVDEHLVDALNQADLRRVERDLVVGERVVVVDVVALRVPLCVIEDASELRPP
jgi:hypothetical protein